MLIEHFIHSLNTETDIHSVRTHTHTDKQAKCRQLDRDIYVVVSMKRGNKRAKILNIAHQDPF